MNYADLAATLGTQQSIAKALGVTQGTVSIWKKKGIPLWRQWQIQLVTGGRLTAERLKENAPAQ